MLISRAVVATVAFVSSTLVTASSTARNPLKSLGVARDPSILTQSHRVNILSTFDLAFDFSGTRIRLSLEPNHDIITENAVITYARADGRIMKEEPINRQDHKVFKGTTWVKRGNRWDSVGWSRITIRRDGVSPLFEGVFTIDHNHHHIQLSTNYKQTKHDLDPDLDMRDDEFMVIFRDSDISDASEHMELKKRSEDLGCGHDQLEFNMNLEHPIYSDMATMSRRDVLKRDDGFWSAPISSMFGKRQLDNSPGGGNGAGVNLVQSIGSTAGCPTTRKVALVGVAADCTYIKSFNSTESARANIINQINSASNLYESTFNISLGLANLFVVERECPTSVQTTTPWNQDCSSNLDIQERLNLFSQWRGTQRDTNSHWTLLSTCNTGSAVGLAWLGQACTQGSQPNNSSAGSSETVAGANVVIRTSTEWQVIAHETGHTFGAVHDCTSQACANTDLVNSQQCCPLSSSTCDAGERFIMNPSTAQGITRFSPCTVGNICSALLRNSVKGTCLTNNRGVTTITGQQCGNGIVEEGEDCDCGGEQGCGDNACCDATTCKFKNNAVCDDSTEDCCRDCQLASASTVCRPSTGQCDPQETCTGTSPYCPEDKTQDDGSSCGNGLKCASGQCTSRDQQCKTVMGSYTTGNDTYACDNSNCMLSCASPEFGRGVCYGLQQNFLDGTPCGAGGKCSNGRCSGSSIGNEVKSWIDRNKTLVIGIASAVGGLLLLSILGCIYRCFKRKRTRKIYAASPYVAPPGYGRSGGPSRRGTGVPPVVGGPNVGGVPQTTGVSAPWVPPRNNLNGVGPGGAPIPPPPTYTRSASVRYA